MMKNLLLLMLMAPFFVQAQDFVDSAEKVKPLLPGMEIPALSFTGMDGKTQQIDSAKMQKPVVLTFYRGGWCPYCSAYLGEMRLVEDELKAMGFDVYFVSPSLPMHSQKMQQENPDYTLLADADMSASKALGIAFQLDEKTKNKYINYGIDLKKLSGHDGYLLPAPATFLIGKEGVIQFQYVNPDYKIRLAPSILMAAAKDYLKRTGHSAKK